MCAAKPTSAQALPLTSAVKGWQDEVIDTARPLHAFVSVCPAWSPRRGCSEGAEHQCLPKHQAGPVRGKSSIDVVSVDLVCARRKTAPRRRSCLVASSVQKVEASYQNWYSARAREASRKKTRKTRGTREGRRTPFDRLKRGIYHELVQKR